MNSPKLPKGQYKVVPFSDLKESFFVRVAIDEARVEQFWFRYEEEGVKALPELWVTFDNRIVDGRHRYQALKQVTEINAKKVKVYELEEKNEANLIAIALKANTTGQPLPPNNKDLELTCQLLYKAGWKKLAIVELLTPILGLRGATQRAEWAKSHLNAHQVNVAADAVRSGTLSTIDAAAKYKVPIEKLQAALGGKSKKNEESLKRITDDIKNKIDATNRSVGKYMQNLLVDVQEGLVNPKDARRLLDLQSERMTKQRSRLEDWYNRLEKYSNGHAVMDEEIE